MRIRAILAGIVVVIATSATPAVAQRFPFDRSFDVTGPSTLDVSTIRGKIDIVAGKPGRIIVTGVVTVRVAWDVPANAVELAQQVAVAPPLERDRDTIRLRPPSDTAAQRAVTVSYQVQVPPNTEVRATSDSGATTVRGVTARVDVRTQSGAIDLGSLAGVVSVSSGSGAVTIDGVEGALTVTTVSSAFAGSGLGSSLRVRTRSGEVDAALTGAGDVVVETGSSAIRLRGVRGGLTATTQSGRVSVQGVPGRLWTATSGSSRVEMDVGKGAAFSIDARSRSGSVTVEGDTVQGSVAKRQVEGTVNGGGPLVQINSGSGAIRIRTAVR